jgi:hypothetical protein
MNIEELKLILETIRSLSGDASTAAYWYFGLEFAKYVLGWLVSAGVVLTITRTIAVANGVGADEAFMRECRDALGTGCRGELTDNERAATQQAIRKLIQESKQ